MPLYTPLGFTNTPDVEIRFAKEIRIASRKGVWNVLRHPVESLLIIDTEELRKIKSRGVRKEKRRRTHLPDYFPKLLSKITKISHLGNLKYYDV